MEGFWKDPEVTFSWIFSERPLSLIVLEDSVVNVLLSLVIGYEQYWDAGAGGCSLRRSSKFLSFFSNSVSLSEAAQSFWEVPSSWAQSPSVLLPLKWPPHTLHCFTANLSVELPSSWFFSSAYMSEASLRQVHKPLLAASSFSFY